MPTIISALAVLEKHGISELDSDVLGRWRPALAGPPDVIEAMRTLISLEIVFVRSTGRRPDPLAHLTFSTHGSAVGNYDQLNRLVADRAAKKHRKLAAAASASERHLFVWLTGTYPDAELAFSTLPPPSTAPSIPTSIDVVWLATPSNGGPNRMWTLRPPAGWENVDLSFLGKRYSLPPWLRSEPPAQSVRAEEAHS